MNKREASLMIDQNTREFIASGKKPEIVPIWKSKMCPTEPRTARGESQEENGSRWHGKSTKNLSRRWNDGKMGAI